MEAGAVHVEAVAVAVAAPAPAPAARVFAGDAASRCAERTNAMRVAAMCALQVLASVREPALAQVIPAVPREAAAADIMVVVVVLGVEAAAEAEAAAGDNGVFSGAAVPSHHPRRLPPSRPRQMTRISSRRRPR